jgi:hypothetical protein
MVPLSLESLGFTPMSRARRRNPNSPFFQGSLKEELT